MALKSTSKKTLKTAAASKSPVARKAPTTSKPAAKAASVTPVRSEAPAAKAKAAKDARPITFTYFAPQAGSVLVAGDFTRWESAPIQLAKAEGGVWKTTVELKPGKYQYRLLVDGQWQNDPQCPELLPNEFGTVNCVLSVAA